MASKVMTSSKPRNSDLSGSSSSTRSRRPTTSTSASLNNHHLQRRRPNHHQQQPFLSGYLTSSPPPMMVDGMTQNPYGSSQTLESADSTLLDPSLALIEPPIPVPGVCNVNNSSGGNVNGSYNGVESTGGGGKTVEEVWREIVAGRREMKEEEDEAAAVAAAAEEEEMMTLEDFLVKAGAAEGGEEDDVKMPLGLGGSGMEGFGFDPSVVIGGSGGSAVSGSAFHLLDRVEGAIVGFGNGVEVVGGGGAGTGAGRGGKRGRGAMAGLMEPMEKAAQQRQRRMIKNRESAARSRERKQAYQVELESQAVRLEEENELLVKEQEETTRERLKQLVEKVIPVVEKRRPPRVLRRVRSLQWMASRTMGCSSRPRRGLISLSCSGGLSAAVSELGNG